MPPATTRVLRVNGLESAPIHAKAATISAAPRPHARMLAVHRMNSGLIAMSARPTSGTIRPSLRAASHTATGRAKPLRNPNRRSVESVDPPPTAIQPRRSRSESAGADSKSRRRHSSASDAEAAVLTPLTSSRHSARRGRKRLQGGRDACHTDGDANSRRATGAAGSRATCVG